MAVEVDVRGYSCPVPVVKTKKAMEENPGKEIKVTADTRTSCDNINRLGNSSGYSVKISEEGDDFVITLSPTK
jgi:tRNA 2-thiouridine synthesizing protein A